MTDNFWFWTTTWKQEIRFLKNWNKRIYVECKCVCWVIRYVCRGNLRSWATESCWCISKKRRKKEGTYSHRKTHWMSKSKIYRIYSWIKTRCNNKSASDYLHYWGRWIKCLWPSFDEFYNDMWKTYKPGLTIDRIDVNWDYCKENCRRIGRDKQMRNRTDNVFVEYRWVTQTLIQWAEQTGINYYTLQKRHSKGWEGDLLFHKGKLTWQKQFYDN